MNAGSPGQDNSGEPAPAPDPWSRQADFGEPAPATAPAQPGPAAQAAPLAQPAQPAPLPSEPDDFVSPAPAAWSAPAEWTAPTSPSWPAPVDRAAQQPAGNGFSPTDADPWRPQPPAGSSAGQQAPVPAGQQGAAPAGQQGAAPAGQYGLPPGQFGPPTAGPYGHQSPYYTPDVARTNPLAIAALVCGIAQILGFVVLLGNVLLAVPAVICGAIALRQVQARGERGRGMAIAGLVLGIVGIVLFVLFLGLVILGLVVDKHRGA